MRHLDKDDCEDIRNWKYQGFFERIKVSIFWFISCFAISFILLKDILPDPKGVWFYLDFAVLMATGAIVIIILNVQTTKHNREVKKFKQMNEGEQDEYLSRRN